MTQHDDSARGPVAPGVDASDPESLLDDVPRERARAVIAPDGNVLNNSGHLLH